MAGRLGPRAGKPASLWMQAPRLHTSPRLRQCGSTRRLDEGKLSEALSEAPPSLPESVIANVAEAFRGLDQDPDEFERLELASAGSDRFLKSYRTYVRAAARRRAEWVRSNHARYEEIGRKLKASRGV